MSNVLKRQWPNTKTRAEAIGGLIYSGTAAIADIAVWETGDCVSAKEAARKRFKPCKAGREWGGPWRTAWFRFRFKIPKSQTGDVVARINTGGEAVAFINGSPCVGLNAHRDEIVLPKATGAGRMCEILVEAGANGMFGHFTDKPRLARAELAAVNESVRQLWYDLDFLIRAAEALPQDSTRRAEICYVTEKAVKAFDFDADDLAATADQCRRMLRPLFAKRAHDSAVELTLSGHSHLDVIWLWPLWETTRKCARTFSSMVDYIGRFPKFTFTQSQAYLYETTKQHYPRLYGRIRRAVRARRWEVSTGMYVEADTNIPSGESLVRQVMFGKRFARDEFNVDVDVLMLPDVFGYSASLPQILRKAGIKYFTTQKLAWNDTNSFPHTTFTWEGIDGSEILAHFLPSQDYNSSPEPGELAKAEKGHRDKDRSRPGLYQYGYGDGGGGPTPQMIEYAGRATSFEGLPKCKSGFVSELFRKLERESADLARWVGEFYFECHRGTFTTQAMTKMLNRRCELALRHTELLGAIGSAIGGKYDRDALAECWKLVLLNQFHDVLPGTSISAVYELVTEQLTGVIARSAKLADNSAAAIAKQIDTTGDGRPVVVWNTLSWYRTGVVRIRPKTRSRLTVIDSQGESVPSQKCATGELTFLAADIPAMGYEVYRLVEGAPKAAALPLKVTERLLENEFLRVRINKNGELTSVYDKASGREALGGGRGNEFQLYEDRPHNWDAWELDDHPRDERLRLADATSVKVVERGPVRAAVEIRRTIGKSSLVQRVVLYAHSARIDFETRIDWCEDRKVLKVAFPVDVRARQATYEIQFGSLERPTHRNTSWDVAKFEVPAHKWADLSEPGYGVSLLNDCKYGHDIHGNTMRLTLLRAPMEPDPQADRGHHEFAYALMPHAGSYIDAETVRRGYEFNVPPAATMPAPRKGDLPTTCSFFWIDSAAVVLDTVKKAEDEDALILRLYEAHGGRANARLVTPLPVKSAVECDLLERKALGKPAKPKDCSLALEFAPFEIKTLKLKLA